MKLVIKVNIARVELICLVIGLSRGTLLGQEVVIISCKL